MSINKQKKKYHLFDHQKGYPSAEGYYYECLICRDIIPSKSANSIHCSCRNIMLDADYGRLVIRDNKKIKFFEVLKEGNK